MNYKLPFFILVVGVTALGLIAFSPAIYAAIEPHITIMMDPGQTTNPFVIKDDLNNDVFRIHPDGTIFPSPIETVTTAFSQQMVDDIYQVLHYSAPDTVITETAESGAGVYQFEHTLTSNDFQTTDTLGIWTTTDFTPYVSMSLENTGVSLMTINVKIFFNDVEINSDSLASVDGGNFARHDFANIADIYQVTGYYDIGDTIGVKVWSDQTGDLELSQIAIVGIPDLGVNVLTVAYQTNVERGGDFTETSFIPTDPFTTAGITYLSTGNWRDECSNGELIADTSARSHVFGARICYTVNESNFGEVTSVEGHYWLAPVSWWTDLPDGLTYTKIRGT